MYNPLYNPTNQGAFFSWLNLSWISVSTSGAVRITPSSPEPAGTQLGPRNDSRGEAQGQLGAGNPTVIPSPQLTACHLKINGLEVEFPFDANFSELLLLVPGSDHDFLFVVSHVGPIFHIQKLPLLFFPWGILKGFSLEQSPSPFLPPFPRNSPGMP